MIAQVSVKECFKQDARKLLGEWDEDEFRDNEYLRARGVILIADVGAVIKRHALEMGVDAGEDCAFQVDRYSELLIWQLVEYLAQSAFEGESREANVGFYQVDERPARPWFDWPPAPESEV